MNEMIFKGPEMSAVVPTADDDMCVEIETHLGRREIMPFGDWGMLKKCVPAIAHITYTVAVWICILLWSTSFAALPTHYRTTRLHPSLRAPAEPILCRSHLLLHNRSCHARDLSQVATTRVCDSSAEFDMCTWQWFLALHLAKNNKYGESHLHTIFTHIYHPPSAIYHFCFQFHVHSPTSSNSLTHVILPPWTLGIAAKVTLGTANFSVWRVDFIRPFQLVSVSSSKACLKRKNVIEWMMNCWCWLNVDWQRWLILVECWLSLNCFGLIPANPSTFCQMKLLVIMFVSIIVVFS